MEPKRKNCDICNKSLNYSYLSEHNKTKSHAKKVKSKQTKIELLREIVPIKIMPNDLIDEIISKLLELKNII